MSGSGVAYLACVVLAVEALVMGNLWALGMGLFFAVVGILLEREAI
jgi:hypothetical protein